MKITEYELLSQYSSYIIKRKIKALQESIDAAYHLSTSHTTFDEVEGMISVSCSVEKLVIWITKQKDDLNRFKINSSKKLNLIKKIISNYSSKEQKEVMKYFNSNGSNKALKTINKLQEEIYIKYIIISV